MRSDNPSGSPQHVEVDPQAARRVRIVLSSVLALYIAALAALVITNHIGVVWKSLVVPGLALAAFLVGRLRSFVREWLLFLAAVMVFDAARGLVYATIVQLKMPVYMMYAIDAERALFGEPLLPLRVQHWLCPDGNIDWIDRMLALAYASHFVVFLLYGLVIWLVRHADFGRFKVGLLLIMYGGIVCYLVVPTVPPWMASGVYFVIPPIKEIGAELFQGSLPTVAAAFAINPIAAMPSLHCAFPSFLTMVTFHLFGAWGIVMAAYACVVFLSTMHLGHHYGVDILGGIFLAFVAYLVCFHGGRLAQRLGVDSVPSADRGALRMRVLVTGLLLTITLASGPVGAAATVGAAELPTESFVRRELQGRSPVVDCIRGMRLLGEGRYAEANRLLGAAITKDPERAGQKRYLAAWLAAAYLDGDYAGVVRVSEQLGGLTPHLAAMVGDALIRTGEYQKGRRLLEQVAAQYPDIVAAVVARGGELEHSAAWSAPSPAGF